MSNMLQEIPQMGRFRLGGTGRRADSSAQEEPPETSTQDGRPLRREARRWKIEGFFCVAQSYRRLAIRYEFHDERFPAIVQLACSMILLRRFHI